MKITSCRFERSVHGPGDDPRDRLPRVLFLGRSNVGKSSLINRLLGVRALARTSAQPGRTQSVNFYRVNEAFYFVDLPGYGYAKVPEAVRAGWRAMVEGFLERTRSRAALSVVVVDARREVTELDEVMRDWLEAKSMPWMLAATKCDKLSGNARSVAVRRIRDRLAPGDVPTVAVSARTGLGLKEIWRHLDRALAAGGPARGRG